MKRYDLGDRRKLHPKTLEAIKPQSKTQFFSDGFGLRLVVPAHSTGGQWRYVYRIAGKQRTFTLGTYPELSLSGARKWHEDAYNLVKNGGDPIEIRTEQREAQKQELESTFKNIAENWFELYIAGKKSKSYEKRVRGLLDNHILPHIGERPVTQLKEHEVSGILRRMQVAEIYSSGDKARQVLRSVLMHARRIGAIDTARRTELIESMDGVIQPPISRKKQNYSAVITPRELKPVLIAIDESESNYVVKTALQLAPMLLMRPIELCGARWKEVNFLMQQLEIEAERMKLREPHIVPLPTQAMKKLNDLHKVTGHTEFLFPSFRSSSRHIATETLTVALRTAGIEKEVQHVHGFRATARTMLAEQEGLKFRTEIIEHQLAHAVRDATGTAYNRTSFLDDRREMLQAWADYLDRLKAGTEVVQLKTTNQ